MLASVAGVFLVLHGLVHLLYVALSRRLFQLRPDFHWPDGSWAFSRLLGNDKAARVATVAYLVATVAFVVGGAGLLLRLDWWRPAVAAAAVFSAFVIILFWDGTRRRLSEQGWVGVLIDAAILVVVLGFDWPAVG